MSPVPSQTTAEVRLVTRKFAAIRRASAVIVSAEEWVRKTVRKGTLAEFLLASPLRGADLELERQRDAPRDVKL